VVVIVLDDADNDPSIFEEIIAIKECFNLEFPIKVIGGKKFGYIAKGDVGEWFGWFIGVGD